MNANQAIDRSASHNETVTLDYSTEAYRTLLVECDDSGESNDAHEFWGTTEDGSEWRVHVSHVSDDMIETLRDEAKAAGDDDMATLCKLALRGDEKSRAKCVAAIDQAADMSDEEQS